MLIEYRINNKYDKKSKVTVTFKDDMDIATPIEVELDGNHETLARDIQLTAEILNHLSVSVESRRIRNFPKFEDAA